VASWTRRIVMDTKFRVAVAAGATLLSVAAFTGIAGADESSPPEPASICGYSSAPDGVVVLGDQTTYNNAGEVVSYVAPPVGIPGELVRSICNPTLQP
jgi:hypothetical protein